jgi:hypothetical protein
MSRPNDIPEDVWEAASLACTAAPEYTMYLHEKVARAILAERDSGRERWAQYLEAVVRTRESQKRRRGNDYILAAASSIRKGEPK